MDYSKLPLARRTRLQEAAFYRDYNEEKKRKKAAENGGDGGRREGESGGVASVEGGDSRCAVADSGGRIDVNNVGSREGFGIVISEKGENSGVKEVEQSRQGEVPIDSESEKIMVHENVGAVGGVDLKEKHESCEVEGKSQNVVRLGVDDDGESDDVVSIDCDSKRIRGNRKGMEKHKNVADIDRVDLETQHESCEGAKESSNMVQMGVDDEDESEHVVSIDCDSKRIGENKKGLGEDTNGAVDGVDLKKKDQSCERGQKNMNVVPTGLGDDEVEFLGMRYGKVIEVDEVDEIGVVGSNCSTDLKDSKESRESRYAMESNSIGSVESVSDLGDSEESESSSEEENDSSSDQDYEGSGNDVDSDDSCSSSDYGDEDDEDESSVVSIVSLNGQRNGKLTRIGSVGGEGKDKMVEVGLQRGRGKSPEVVCLGQSSSSIVDGNGKESEGNGKRKVGIVEGDGKQETFEGGQKRARGRPRGTLGTSYVVDEEKDGSGGLKRRKISGLDILVDSQNEEDGKEESEGPKSVAERLHLRRRSVSDSKESGEKKKELGSFSCPFTVTDEELDSSSGGDNDTRGEAKTNFEISKDAKDVGKSGEKGEGKVGRPAKRRCICADSAVPISSVDKILADSIWQKTCFQNSNDAKDVWKSGEKGEGKVGTPAKRSCICADSTAPISSVDKILADSIWQKGDVPREDLVPPKVPDEEPTLPLKFRFQDEDPDPPEKSYWEIEADKLFAEMDFVLAACEIGSSDSSTVDNEDSFTQEIESDSATSCHQGKHQFVLDEQIGLKCRFCSFVMLEIKHILPSFSKHPLGRPDKKDWYSPHDFNVNELQFEDSDSLYKSSSEKQTHAEGTVWDIIPGIKSSMYPHQREGFEFIWKNIAGSIDLEELKKTTCDGGSGCIISHAPGTGKTRLAIVFLQTFMELNPTCMPVIIAPRSMLLTWEEEFRKWKVDIPFHNLNKTEFSGRENEVAVNLLRKVGRGGQNQNSIRLVKLFSWRMDRSVLGVSYRLFEKLAEDGIVSADEGGKRKRKTRRYAEAEQVRKMLLELPGLLVLDEGHTPRNDQSLIWQALSRVQTQRRIILSGTPFQNNFDELFNTLCLVRPKFSERLASETRRDFVRKRGRKCRAARGKWASLTNSIGKDTDDKLDKLRAMIDPFVHIHKGAILKESLPGLRDSMVFLHPTLLQESLIEVVQGRRNPFKLDHLVSLISVHPSLLLGCDLSEKEGLSVDTDKLERLRFDPKAGVKTNFLMELIRLSMALKEKVLVFSQYIEPLTFVREQLKSNFHWTEGKELLYMDGKIEAKNRQSLISLLNDPGSEVRVLLASTKACSEGINLVGASRVVLLDVVWNPSVERQAISRAYRLGQKKVVYIYRLVTSGTKEGEKYVRQAEKDRLSELVFSSADGGVHKPEISCVVAEDKILQEMVQHEKISNMFEKILNQPNASKLIDTFG